MKTSFVINADDFGFSRGINESILDAADNSALSGVSLISNGSDLPFAFSELQKRPWLRLSVHLNLTDGEPLGDAKEGILTRNGVFCHSFQSLWLAYLRSRRKERELMKNEVKKEIRAQIQKVKEVFGENREISVDGHEHIHMIPFVFDALLELSSEFHFANIRTPSEPFFVSIKKTSDLSNYFGLNIVKHFLLNALSVSAKKKLDAKRIPHTDYFIGVLFTGNMTFDAVKAGFARIPHPICGKRIEILFHPGGAKESERGLWGEGRKRFAEWYFSSGRKKEREELKRQDFKEFISHLTL
ncbi:MAG: ChbG/HpnK family deacetylase [Candidatus Paceibacterota bacterium]|jgi:predicted glycoside hydrolase/deacetylase ChbG (UPF0249 family)